MALIPISDIPNIFNLWDKVQHALAFTVLTITGSLAFPKKTKVVYVGLMLYGVCIEIIQSTLTTTRFGEASDLLADSVGVMVGIIIYLAVRKNHSTHNIRIKSSLLILPTNQIITPSLKQSVQCLALQTSQRRALRAIALFETTKGIAAIIASLGLLSLANQHVRDLTFLLIRYLHLDSDAHYFKTLFDYSDLLSNDNLRTVVLMAWAYASMRFAESYGLWKNRVWAEWMAAVSGAIYLPVEISHIIKHASAINTAVLMTNATVVAYMMYRLWWRRTEALRHK